MGYFKTDELTLARFRDRIGMPQIRLHAELRYAERVLGHALSKEDLLSDPSLRERCRRGILRNFEDADEVIASRSDQDVHHLFRRNRCLVLVNDHVVTLYDINATGVDLDLQKKRILRGRLPGIETFEALRARRSA
ncbi:hypothetical protein OAN47_03230 [Planctomycetota bacterium]|nr:hypothetical protein [Planctomycetota bacterium]